MRRRHRQRLYHTLPSAFNRFFELRTELSNRSLHRPTGAITQSTNRRARNDSHPIGDIDQDIEIFAPSVSASHSIGNLQHPSRTFAARRALTTALVREELTGVVQDVDHACLIVDHRHRRGAETETADAARPVEIERDVVLGQIAVLDLVIALDEPHANSAWVHRFRLATFPNSAAV